MNIGYSSHFIKSHKKLSKKIQHKVIEKIFIFEHDEFDPALNNHKLHGEYGGYRSINITSDVRAIYRKISDENYYFEDVGTHSKLYN